MMNFKTPVLTTPPFSFSGFGLYVFQIRSLASDLNRLSPINSEAARTQALRSLCIKMLSLRNPFRSETSTYDASDWNREWRLAEERNDLDAGAFILAQQILRNSRSLRIGIFERAGLKAYSRTLDNSDLYFSDAVGNPLTVHQIYGQLFKSLFRNYLWMLGPFAFRWLSNLEERHKFAMLAKRLRSEWVRNHSVDHGFFERIGIPASPFGDRVFQSVFLDEDPKARMRAEQKGWFLGPAMLFLVSLSVATVTGLPLHPEIVAERVSSRGPNYSSTDFVEDFQKASGRSLKEAEVTYITDVNLLSDAMDFDSSQSGKLSKEVLKRAGSLDSAKIPFIENVRANAKSFHLEVVESVASLNKAIRGAKDSDFVFLNFHGAPGTMDVGGIVIGTDFEGNFDNLNAIESNQLKPGAALIYFSCNFGEKQSGLQGDEEESWIKISRKLQTSGLAIAPVNRLTFRAFDIVPSKLTGSRTLNWGQISAVFGTGYLMLGESVLRQSFLGPWSYRDKIVDGLVARPKVLEGDRPSFRIFHPETGVVEHCHPR